MKKISVLIMGLSFFLGCGADKSQETEEAMNSNKEPVVVYDEESVEAASQKKRANSLLHAPGNYIRTTVGQLDKAKKAAAVYENSALEHMDVSESTGE